MIECYLDSFVCERFKNDVRYREGHLRVINALPTRRVLGLHTPDMKRIAKELSIRGAVVSMPWGDVLCSCGAEVLRCFEQVAPHSLSYEETMVWGFLINNGRYSDEERFAMLSRFVPVMDNWAVCDAYCADAKWMARTDKERLWSYLQPWFNSGREFEVRFALVVSMCRLLCDGWVDRVFARIDRLDFGAIESAYRTIQSRAKNVQDGCVQGAAPYYVRMGCAWLLATALAKYPERTRAFVNSSSLPADVVKLYVRKARESFRTRMVEAI
ncbi:MAG: DNA alkylation repair protein [Bacteroidaceae bacterium]|nr:DNA alkylation repair protein [Bacteroidaceae bacterium]